MCGIAGILETIEVDGNRAFAVEDVGEGKISLSSNLYGFTSIVIDVGIPIRETRHGMLYQRGGSQYVVPASLWHPAFQKIQEMEQEASSILVKEGEGALRARVFEPLLDSSGWLLFSPWERLRDTLVKSISTLDPRTRGMRIPHVIGGAISQWLSKCGLLIEHEQQADLYLQQVEVDYPHFDGRLGDLLKVYCEPQLAALGLDTQDCGKKQLGRRLWVKNADGDTPVDEAFAHLREITPINRMRSRSVLAKCMRLENPTPLTLGKLPTGMEDFFSESWTMVADNKWSNDEDGEIRTEVIIATERGASDLLVKHPTTTTVSLAEYRQNKGRYDALEGAKIEVVEDHGSAIRPMVKISYTENRKLTVGSVIQTIAGELKGVTRVTNSEIAFRHPVTGKMVLISFVVSERSLLKKAPKALLQYAAETLVERTYEDNKDKSIDQRREETERTLDMLGCPDGRVECFMREKVTDSRRGPWVPIGKRVVGRLPWVRRFEDVEDGSRPEVGLCFDVLLSLGIEPSPDPVAVEQFGALNKILQAVS